MPPARTTPKRRKINSCDNCRLNKLKCIRQEPHNKQEPCDGCRRRDLICKYTTDQQPYGIRSAEAERSPYLPGGDSVLVSAPTDTAFAQEASGGGVSPMGTVPPIPPAVPGMAGWRIFGQNPHSQSGGNPSTSAGILSSPSSPRPQSRIQERQSPSASGLEPPQPPTAARRREDDRARPLGAELSQHPAVEIIPAMTEEDQKLMGDVVMLRETRTEIRKTRHEIDKCAQAGDVEISRKRLDESLAKVEELKRSYEEAQQERIKEEEALKAAEKLAAEKVQHYENLAELQRKAERLIRRLMDPDCDPDISEQPA